MPEDKLQHAAFLIEVGQKAEARTLLTQIVRESPDNGQAWHLLSQVLDNPDQVTYSRKRAADLGYQSPPVPAVVQSTMPAQPKAQSQKPTTSKPPANNQQQIIGCLGLIVIVAVIGACLWVFGTLGSGSSPSGTEEPSIYEAYAMCQQFIEEKLVSPGSAKYPVASDAKITHTGDRWVVSAYVDSQNGFGALIRSNFTCDMTSLGNRRWHANKIDIK